MSASPDGDTVTVEITVWSALVSDLSLAQLAKCLAPEERARAGKFRNKVSAQEFISGRSVTRLLLAPFCGVGADALVLSSHPGGKPYVADCDVAFNLSHSAGTCALAIGRVRNIGIDVEWMNANTRTCTDDIFDSREAALFASLPTSKQTEAFYRAWVMKEAYLKATGHGLAGGMKSLEVIFEDGPVAVPVAIRGETDLAHWSFAGFDGGVGIAGAVAVDTSGRQIDFKFRRISSESLL